MDARPPRWRPLSAPCTMRRHADPQAGPDSLPDLPATHAAGRLLHPMRRADPGLRLQARPRGMDRDELEERDPPPPPGGRASDADAAGRWARRPRPPAYVPFQPEPEDVMAIRDEEESGQPAQHVDNTPPDFDEAAVPPPVYREPMTTARPRRPRATPPHRPTRRSAPGLIPTGRRQRSATYGQAPDRRGSVRRSGGRLSVSLLRRTMAAGDAARVRCRSSASSLLGVLALGVGAALATPAGRQWRGRRGLADANGQRQPGAERGSHNRAQRVRLRAAQRHARADGWAGHLPRRRRHHRPGLRHDRTMSFDGCDVDGGDGHRAARCGSGSASTTPMDRDTITAQPWSANGQTIDQQEKALGEVARIVRAPAAAT